MKTLSRTIRRNTWVQKRLYNFLNRILKKSEDLRTLNCGLLPEAGFQVDESAASNLLTRLGLELYHLVGTQSPIPITDTKILEIGCGRGGGTHFLAAYFHPEKILGIDFSVESIQQCRRRYKDLNLQFLVANALNLPLEDGYFDLAISIEICHMINDKIRFFEEAKRVIKPGGYLLYLDFIYTNGDSTHSTSKIEQAISEAGLKIKSTTDLTAQVFEALKLAAPIREELISQKCPGPLQSFAHEFCMTSNSRTYAEFKDGRTRYLFYTLKKSK